MAIAAVSVVACDTSLPATECVSGAECASGVCVDFQCVDPTDDVGAADAIGDGGDASDADAIDDAPDGQDVATDPDAPSDGDAEDVTVDPDADGDADADADGTDVDGDTTDGDTTDGDAPDADADACGDDCAQVGEGCGGDTDCATGHCANGFCCVAGECCGAGVDCASLVAGSPPTCDDSSTCQGTRGEGVCGDESVCVVARVPDDSACDGSVESTTCGGYVAATCSGESDQPGAAACDATCAVPAPDGDGDGTPDACELDATDESCDGFVDVDARCAGDLWCVDGVCVGGRLVTTFVVTNSRTVSASSSVTINAVCSPGTLLVAGGCDGPGLLIQRAEINTSTQTYSCRAQGRDSSGTGSAYAVCAVEQSGLSLDDLVELGTATTSLVVGVESSVAASCGRGRRATGGGCDAGNGTLRSIGPTDDDVDTFTCSAVAGGVAGTLSATAICTPQTWLDSVESIRAENPTEVGGEPLRAACSTDTLIGGGCILESATLVRGGPHDATWECIGAPPPGSGSGPTFSTARAVCADSTVPLPCNIGGGDSDSKCQEHSHCDGGACVADLPIGLRCDEASDCDSGVCTRGECVPAHCGNGLADTELGETSVDCGGECPC